MIRHTFTGPPPVVPSPVGWQDSLVLAHSYRWQWPASRRNWHFRPQSHFRHPSSRFFRLTLPCSLVACDARLPVHLITQNHTQKLQSTNQVPIDNCHEEAVLEGKNMGPMAVDSDSILHTPPSPRLTPSSNSFHVWTRLLSSRLAALMTTFFQLLTSPPVFLLLLPAGARALAPGARTPPGALRRGARRRRALARNCRTPTGLDQNKVCCVSEY